MKDVHTEEQLVFKCKRWLSRDEDDLEVCRELPAVREKENPLPSEWFWFDFEYTSFVQAPSDYIQLSNAKYKQNCSKFDLSEFGAVLVALVQKENCIGSL